MDPRHESLKEGFLNHVIMTINTYMLDNIDVIVKDPMLHDEMKEICERIYHYLDVRVDTQGILSRHNLLSKDVVTFPNVPDPESSRILDQDEFENLLQAIKKIIQQDSHGDDVLRKQILRVMEEFEL